jgi:hypothetical protein
MGSPIKVPQANSKPESDQGNRKRWAALRNRNLKFYFIFIPIVVFVGGIVFNYSNFLPGLDPRVFESLVQVIATFLGFTIVAFFYYLGKIDDRKNDYINSITSRMRFYGDFISKNEELLLLKLNATKNFREDTTHRREDTTYRREDTTHRREDTTNCICIITDESGHRLWEVTYHRRIVQNI